MNNYILFIDTEASGLPKKWNAPYSKENNWPYAVQVAWIICTDEGDEVKQENHYIQNNDFKITPSAIKIHGITRDFLNKEGKSRKWVLEQLNNDIEKYKPMLVGHFIELDYHVISADGYRSYIENPFKDRPLFCTMVGTKGYLPNTPVKYLKLYELYALLFNETLENRHDAIADARATARCFFELRRRGDIKPEYIETQQPLNVKAEKTKATGCSLFFAVAIFITLLICYSV